MATKPIIARPERTQVWHCAEGHPVTIRVHADGSIRGDGRLICPVCRSEDLRLRT